MATPRKKESKKAAPAKASAAKDKGKAAATKAAPSKSKAPSPPPKPVVAAKPKPAGRGAPVIPSSAPANIFTKRNAPRPAARIEAPPKLSATAPTKPSKPVVDEEWQTQMREMMAHQRQQLLSVVQSTQAQMAEKSGDLPDVSDRASEGFEDELAVGLMAIEAAQLDDIDYAIARIDDGTYGLCVDCGKPIPRKRLEVLPFARRCLACEGSNERRTKAQEPGEEEEESE
jgi:DnaK suppressor protein